MDKKLKLYFCIILLIFLNSCAHFTKPTDWLLKVPLNKNERIHLSLILQDGLTPKYLSSNHFYLLSEFTRVLQEKGFEVCSYYPSIGKSCTDTKEKDAFLELRLLVSENSSISGTSIFSNNVHYTDFYADLDLLATLRLFNGKEGKKKYGSYASKKFYDHYDAQQTLVDVYGQAVDYLVEDFEADLNFLFPKAN